MQNIHPESFTYYDLRRGRKSPWIDLIFPGWAGDQERLLVLSPHDDDGILGAGYLMLAAMANGAQIYLAIFCDGRFGYSRPEEKDTIVAQRRQETLAAYTALGLQEEHILRFDFPDFSIWPRMGWYQASGDLNAMGRFLPECRKIAPTRLLLPNGYREHLDHEATYRIGAYDGPQAGDAVAADYGRMPPVKSYLQYSVWGDFTPEEALAEGASARVRANRAVQVPLALEETIRAAIWKFQSQSGVLVGLMAARDANRVRDGKGLEVYLDFNPRPP